MTFQHNTSGCILDLQQDLMARKASMMKNKIKKMHTKKRVRYNESLLNSTNF